MKMLAPDMPMPDKLRAFWSWIRHGRALIKPSDARGLVPIHPRPMQERLFHEIYRMACEEKPIRILGLKARKEGFSTLIQALYFFLCQFTPHWAARVIAHTEDSTTDIFGISYRLAANLKCGPQPSGTQGQAITWDQHDSQLSTRTAGGRHALSGATTNALHVSELSKWPGDGEKVKAQMASVLESVPEHANSMAIIESTTNMIDQSGEFERRWRNAYGNPDSPFLAFFSPWFEEPSYRMPKACHVSGMNKYERWLCTEFKLCHPQIQWRRNKIAGDFGGGKSGEIWFKQEFPATPEEAFQTHTGKIFPMLDRERSLMEAPPRRLADLGYEFVRAIDFGSVDPFVCLWIAHDPKAPPAYTMDEGACPHSWHEHNAYAWDPNGRPRDLHNHTVDAARYAVMHFRLHGHVHLYREYYKPDAAAAGLTNLDHAVEIIRRSLGESYRGSVCDRSRPDTTMLMRQQGLDDLVRNRSLERDGAGGGSEIIQGIDRMQALMNGTAPIAFVKGGSPYLDRMEARRRSLPFKASLPASLRLRVTEANRNKPVHPAAGGTRWY